MPSSEPRKHSILKFSFGISLGVFVIVLTAVFFSGVSAEAATYSWTASASGNWTNTAMWSPTPPAGGPSTGDTVNISVGGGSYTVTLDVNPGALAGLTVGNCGNSPCAPTLSIPSGKTLNLGTAANSVGGGVYPGGTIDLAGVLTVASPGTLTFNTNTALTWSTGTLNGSGTTTVNSGATVTMSNSSYTYLDGQTFNNAGTFNYTPSAYYFSLYNGAHLNNSGTFDAKADGSLNYSGAAPVFTNTGAFLKSAGSGTFTIANGVTFDNSGGVVNADSGTLAIAGGGTSNGSINILAGAVVDFPTSTFTITGGSVAGASGSLQVSGGTLTISASITIPNLALSNGTVNGASPNVLTVNSLNWTGGTMSGTGTTSIPISSTATMTNATNYTYLDTRTFNNAGTFNYTPSAYYFSLYNGAHFNNSGTFDAKADGNLSYGGSAPLFTNTGTFIKSAGSGTFIINNGLIFDNSGGILNANNGTVAIAGGGTSNGTFTIASGSIVDIPNGTYTLTGGSITGLGSLHVSNGTLTISANITIPNLVLSNGTINGASPNVLTVNAFNWTGGVMSGNGATNFNGPVTANCSTGYLVLDTRTVNNAGTFTYSGSSYYLYFSNGATFNNNSGAIFDIQTDQPVSYSGGASTFVNASGAILRKTVGAGTTHFSPILNNSGSVLVSSGTLSLDGGGTSSGAFTANLSCTLDFYTGTYSLTGSSNVSGAGTVSLTSSATVNVAGTYSITGTTSVNGGTINFNAAATTASLNMSGGVIGGTAALTVSGASTLSGGTMNGTGSTTFNGPVTATSATNYILFDARTINNAATFTYSGSPYYLYFSNGATFNNNSGGIFDIQTDQPVSYSGTPSTFVNASGATLKKTGLTGTSHFSPVLNNSGSVIVSSGTLSFDGGGTSPGAFTANIGGTLAFGAGTHSLTGSSNVSGAGTVSVTGGTVNAAGSYNVTGSTSVSGGTINFNAAATTAGLNLSSGGVIGGTAALTVSGASTISGGTMNGGGTTNFNGAVTAACSTNYILFDNRTVNNAGTFTYSGSPYYLYFANAVTFTNNSGAIFDIQTDQPVSYSGTPSTFNNASGGTLEKTAGTGTTHFLPAFNNSGNVLVSSGTLSFDGGGTSPGTFTVNTPGTLGFGGGTHAITSGISGTGTVLSTAGTTNISGTYSVSGTTLSGGTLNINVAATAGPLVLTGGTINFNGATTATTLNMSGAGTIGGTGALTVSGASTITGGTMNGTGTTNFNGSVSATVSTNYIQIDNRTINNSVSFVYGGTPYYMYFTNGTTFNNNSGATFDIQTDQPVSYSGSVSTFVNAVGATLKKSAGTGITHFSPTLNSSGTVLVTSGTLSLDGGGTSPGTFTVASPGTLSFGGGTATLSSGISGTGGVSSTAGTTTIGGTFNVSATTLSGGTLNINVAATAGPLVLTGGTINFNGATTATTLNMSGAGTIGGTGALTVSGASTITGGTMNGTGTTNFNGSVSATVSTNYIQIDTRTINNAATFTYSGTPYYMYFTNGTTFNNNSGEIFDIQTDQPVSYSGSVSTFVNAVGATLKKSAGTGITHFSPTLNSSGTVLVTSGTLSLDGGGTSPGTFTVTSPGTLSFGGGTATLSSGISGTGGVSSTAGTATIGGTFNVSATTLSGGTLTINVAATPGPLGLTGGTINFNGATTTPTLAMSSGGTIGGTGALTVSGASTISGGIMDGGGTTNFNGPVSATVSSYYIQIDNRTINNAATFTYSGTPYYMYFVNGATFNNNSGGIFDIQTDQPVYVSGSSTFVNAAGGTLKKTAGTSTNFYPALTNNGTILALVGEIFFNGSFTQTGGTTTVGPGTIGSTAALNFNGGVLNGTGTVNAPVNNAAQVNPGSSPGILTINGAYTQMASGTLNIELGGTTLGTQYDQLNVTGAVTLDGTLNVTTIGGFMPVSGNAFKVLTFTSKTNDFATKNGLNLGSGTNLIPTYSASDLTLVTNSIQTDLSVSQTAPASVNNGQTFTYNITVTNGGGSGATGVTLTDTLPSTVTLQGAVPSQGSCSGTTVITCNIGSLATSGTATVAITVKATTAGSAGNVASVTGNEFDPNTANNSSSAPTTIVAVADLSVGITDSPDPVTAGANVTYTIVVTNAGPDVGASPTLNLTLAGGATVVSTSGASCTSTTNSSSCVLSSIASASSTTVTLIAKAASSSPISLTGSVTSTTVDPNNANNSATQSTTVNANADVSITKTLDNTLAAGHSVTYTIVVTNNGPADAVGVTINDPTPAGLIFVSNTGACTSAFPCSIGTLTAGQSATFTSGYTVAGNAIGTITNTATVTAASADSNPTNNSSSASGTVNVSADLAVSKSGPTNNPGSSVTYSITVTNFGPSDAAAVTVTDPTSAGLTLVSVSGACSSFPCSLGTMTVGQVRTIQSQYNVVTTSAFTNTATVSSTTNDPQSSNNSASVVTTQATCPANAPSNLVPSDGATNVATGGTLSWNGAGGFNVYLGAVGAGCSRLIGGTSGTSLTYGGLDPGTTYEWRVEAVGPGCPTKSTACIRFTTAAVCVNAPATLIGPLNTTVSSPLTFTWSSAQGATNYRLFINGSQVTSTNATSYATSLPDGTATWFVVADFPLCPSLQSQSGSLTVCNTTVTPIPSVVSAVNSGDTFTVQWDSTGAPRYEIDEATEGTFANATTQTVTTPSASFQHTVTTATAYFYRVRAFIGCANAFGPNSATVQVVLTPVTPPSSNPNQPVPIGTTGLVTVQVHIDGLPGQTLPFTAALDNKPWLVRVEPASGALPPEGLTFLVYFDPSHLPNGTFTGTVILTVITPGKGPVVNGVTTISAPVSISLVTPVKVPLPGGTPPPNALIVASVGHLDGVNSKWVSDIAIGNVGTQKISYQLTFSPQDASKGQKQTVVDVDAGSTMALDDMIKTWYGVGVLGDGANGVLEIRPLDAKGKGLQPDDVSVSLATVASSRTTNVGAAGNLSEFIPATPFSSFIGRTLDPSHPPSVLSMQQVGQSDTSRMNLGIVEAAGLPASVLVSVFDPTGARILDYPLDLKGGEQRQLNSFLAQNRISLPDGRIEVKVTNGEGKITAYASMIDNKSGAPILISGVPVGQSSFDHFVLPGAANLNSATGAWHTDLRIFNPGPTAQSANVTFYPQAGSAEPKTAAVTINSGEVKGMDNVLSSLFGLSDTGGAIHVTTDNAAPLVVTARTYNQTADGNFAEFVPAVTAAESIGKGDRALQILQAEESVRSRINLGVAEVSGKPATVEVSVYVPESKFAVSTQIPLAANGFLQVPVVRSLGLTNVYNARISVRVIDGDGRIGAYGSLIDQKTGAPAFIPAQK
jgi:hypothetical protein